MNQDEQPGSAAFSRLQPTLLALENLARFYPLDAFGGLVAERLHSDILAFLLDPQGPHGLGEKFLSRFIARVAGQAADPAWQRLRGQNLAPGDAVVRTEYRGIDILVEIPREKLAAIIENKVLSPERPGQLPRYFKVIQSQANYRGWAVLGLLLTIEDLPSVDHAHGSIAHAGYAAVCETLESLLAEADSSSSASAREFVYQYTQRLRQRFLGDSDRHKLCRAVFREHRAAAFQLAPAKGRPVMPDAVALAQRYPGASRSLLTYRQSDELIHKLVVGRILRSVIGPSVEVTLA